MPESRRHEVSVSPSHQTQGPPGPAHDLTGQGDDGSRYRCGDGGVEVKTQGGDGRGQEGGVRREGVWEGEERELRCILLVLQVHHTRWLSALHALLQRSGTEEARSGVGSR